MSTSTRVRPGLLSSVAAVTAVVAAAAILTIAVPTRAQEKAVVIPAPTVDQAPSTAGAQVAVFAGGCFWGVQGVYQHTNGVISAISGYAGGQKNTARYELVGSGTTGHAESVKVTYDPKQITYGQLLQIFFSVAHDPTQFNRQGPDIGPQYRSAIFAMDAEQEKVAKGYIAQLSQARVFRGAIVTKIEMNGTFYDAEDYHQDYMTKNPTNPYIVINDRPKVREVQRVFPHVYRATPKLVASR